MLPKQIIDAVWNKGRIVEGYDPNLIRKDACGAWIVRDKFSVLDNPFCWVIDYILPISLGGDDNILNLRPLHILNQKSKGNSYPSYIASMTSSGNENVKQLTVLSINPVLRNQLDELYSNHK